MNMKNMKLIRKIEYLELEEYRHDNVSYVFVRIFYYPSMENSTQILIKNAILQ